MNVATVKAPERVWFWRENAHLSVFLARRAAIGLDVYVYSLHAKIAHAEELWRYNVYFLRALFHSMERESQKLHALKK